jgi:hypothetical protein
MESPVQMLIDASDSNTAKLVSGYAGEVTRAWNAGNAGAGQGAPVQAAMRFWYTPGRSSKKFYGPGMFVLAFSLFPPLLATLSTAREGEQRTILQVYVSSISAHEFLLGKILTFMLVSFCECLVLLTFLFTYFGLDFAGDPTPFSSRPFYMRSASMQALALGGFLLVFMLSAIQLVDHAHVPHRWDSAYFMDKYGAQQKRLIVEPGDTGTYVVQFPNVNPKVASAEFHLRQQVIGEITVGAAPSNSAAAPAATSTAGIPK